MKTANRIATYSTLVANMRVLRATAISVFAGAVLAACGGGAATTENPLTQAPPAGNAPYTGPVARDADVLKFQQEFWLNAKTTDRCGSCHNEVVGQLPMFVRNDDVNAAYDEALTVVNTDQPALSRLVEKVGGGHNCWNEDPSSCAAIMTTWIENWLGSSGDGGRQIVLTPPISTDPGASLNFPADTALFESTVYPRSSRTSPSRTL
jgi:hypothetical protein